MATPVPPKTADHADRATARLPGFESEGPNVQGLMHAVTAGTQNIEDALDDLVNKRAISTAEGVQLDNVGTILDLARAAGQSDSSYAAALLGRAAAISADSGTAEQLIQVYKLLYGADKVLSTDLQPATFETTAVGPLVDDGDPADADVLAAMDGAKAASVQLVLQVCDESCFLWGAAADADANGDLPASATGFGDDADADVNGDIAPSVGGGNLARALT